MPADLMQAVAHANRVLDWQENLFGDEMPPEWMWPLDKEIVEWMERVTAKRKEKAGKADDDDDVEGPMMSNELAAGRR